MNRVALDLGIIKIYWYSILVFLGIVAACFLIYKESKKQKLNKEDLIDLIFYVLIFGIIGARVYYVLFNLSYYLSNPLEIFAVWNGGLAIHGGLIGGLITTIVFCKKRKINLTKMIDILVVGIIIGQAIGRWGNFFNGEAFGPATTLAYLQSIHIPKFIIDGMLIDGVYHIPTFLYESTWCLLGFISMLILRSFKKLPLGALTSFYLIWYGIARFFIEGLRTDSLMLFSLKVAQLVSIIFIIAGIIILIYNIKKKNIYSKTKLQSK
ncbi:MAG: prolipoprotein diacylglyceryl transferase [Bacilli bacterium]|nr:prolipoprotein diacylglyceryl transferase [Bacilli bacterium]